MEYITTQLVIVATTTEPDVDLFASLGVNWMLLGLQTGAFLILLFLLKKYVYPPLVAMLDKRDAAVQESAELAAHAQKHAAESEERTAALLAEARKEAADVVATAREEANQLVEAAHKKAEARADALLTSAQEEIAKEVAHAKKELQTETIELVALATGTVLNEKIDVTKDGELIAAALKGVK